MLGILLDLLAGVVILLSLLWFGWLGLAGLISPGLVGGKNRLGLLGGGVFGCVVSLYLMSAIVAQEAEPEPELTSSYPVSAPVPVPDPPAPPPPPEPPDTTWIVESGVAAAAGEQGALRIGVACRGDDWIVALDVVDEDAGDLLWAHWSWDGGRPVDYNMLARTAAGLHTLTTSRDVISAARIVEQLRERSVLELRVVTASGPKRVEDLFGLSEAAAAINSVVCAPAPRPPAPRAPATFDMDTEAGIVATLLESFIGNSVESVLRSMAGYEPSVSRTGEDRRFTYRFDDGSVLVLVFRPPGGRGSGLVLDGITVR